MPNRGSDQQSRSWMITIQPRHFADPIKPRAAQSTISMCNRSLSMKRVGISLLMGAAAFLISPTAFAQHGPPQTRSAIVQARPEAHGLYLGQARPMTAAYAKLLVAAAIKASCSPPAG